MPVFTYRPQIASKCGKNKKGNWGSYHIVTFSGIYNWTDPRQMEYISFLQYIQKTWVLK